MGNLEQNFNSQNITSEFLEDLLKINKNITNQEILGSFNNLIKLVNGNSKIDDLAKNSVYIENTIGEIYFYLLQKLDKEDLENFDIKGKKTELEQGDTNYSKFIEEVKKIEENGENINKNNISILFGFLEEISNELYENNFIQKNMFQILSRINMRNKKLNILLNTGNNLSKREIKSNQLLENGILQENEEKDKEYSVKRDIKYRQNSFFERLSKILKSSEVETNYIEDLQEVDSDTTILTFHKVMKNEIIDILARLGINIKFSRKGFTSIKLPNGEKIVFIPTKDIGSTTNFSDFETYQEKVEEDKDNIFTVEDYLEKEGQSDIEFITKNTKGVFFLGGTDMTELFKSNKGKQSMVKLSEINSKLAFGSKAEFLLASDKDSLERIIAGETPSFLSTKYTGVADEMNKVLPYGAKVKYYGSNSEGGVQKEKSQNREKVVMNLEAVQSGASMKDTGNYIYRKEEIDGEEKVVVYFPTKRGKYGDFEKKDIRFIFDKEKKYEWLFDSLDVIQTEMNLELSQVNMETRKSVENIVSNIPEKSIKSFLIGIFNYRGKELSKFKRIETEPGKRPIIELNEELLKDEKLMKQAVNLYKEVYSRTEYNEEYSEKDVYKIIQNIIEKGGNFLLRQDNYKRIVGFIASLDLEKAYEIRSEVKNQLKEQIGNGNDNYYIAESGTPEGERKEIYFQNWLKQIITKKGNYIARTNLLNSLGKPNKKIIQIYQNAGFEIINGVNDKVNIPGKEGKNAKVYLVYKNK